MTLVINDACLEKRWKYSPSIPVFKQRIGEKALFCAEQIYKTDKQLE